MTTPNLRYTHTYHTTARNLKAERLAQRELDEAQYEQATHFARIQLLNHQISHNMLVNPSSQKQNLLRSKKRHQELASIERRITQNNKETDSVTAEIEQEMAPLIKEVEMMREQIAKGNEKTQRLNDTFQQTREQLDQRKKQREAQQTTNDVAQHHLQQVQHRFNQITHATKKTQEKAQKTRLQLDKVRDQNNHLQKHEHDLVHDTNQLRQKVQELERALIAVRTKRKEHAKEKDASDRKHQVTTQKIQNQIDEIRNETSQMETISRHLREENILYQNSLDDHEQKEQNKTTTSDALQRQLQSLKIAERESHGNVAILKRKLLQIAAQEEKQDKKEQYYLSSAKQMENELLSVREEKMLHLTQRDELSHQLSTLDVRQIEIIGEIEVAQSKLNYEINEASRREKERTLVTDEYVQLTRSIEELCLNKDNLEGQNRKGTQEKNTLLSQIQLLASQRAQAQVDVDRLRRDRLVQEEESRSAKQERNNAIKSKEAVQMELDRERTERDDQAMKDQHLLQSVNTKLNTLTTQLYAERKKIKSARNGTVRGVKGMVSSRLGNINVKESAVAGEWSTKIHLAAMQKNKFFRHASIDALRSFLKASTDNTGFNKKKQQELANLFKKHSRTGSGSSLAVSNINLQEGVQLRYPVRRWYRVGQCLFEQGESLESLSGGTAFVILEGHASVVVSDSTGNQKQIKHLR